MTLSTDERAMLQETHDAVLTIRSTLAERCPAHLRRIETLEVELWGNPGNDEKSMGIKAHVKSLLQSRKYLWWALRGLWGLLLLIAGGLISWALGS